jgi:hypothetical protein
VTEKLPNRIFVGGQAGKSSNIRRPPMGTVRNASASSRAGSAANVLASGSTWMSKKTCPER